MPAWPVVTDDVGDKISGTKFEKALTDAMKAYVDGLVVSAVNPGVDANDIIDEVVTARGTKASLDARLDVALNDDGTPKPVAGQATETQVGRQANGVNLARNPYMLEWSDGAAAAPDYYTLAGAGAPAIQQCGTGLGDATQVGAGRYTARVTSDAGNAAQLQQIVIASTEMDDFTSLRGRKVNFMVRARGAAAGMFKLVVTDGVATTSSGGNVSAGVDEDLAVQHTIDSTATYLQVAVEVTLGTNIVYIGAFHVSFGDVLPTRWTPSGALEPYRSPTPRLLHRQLTSFGSNTVLANSRYVYSMPANTLSEAGQYLDVAFAGSLANNANAKSIRLYVGTNFLTILVDNAALASNIFTVRGKLTRTNSTTVAFDGIVTFHAIGGAPPTVWHWANALAGGATDLTTAQDVVVELVAAVANNDIVLARTTYVLNP